MKKLPTNLIISALIIGATSSLSAAEINVNKKAQTELNDLNVTVNVKERAKGVSSMDLFKQSEALKLSAGAFETDLSVYNELMKGSGQSIEGYSVVQSELTTVCGYQETLKTQAKVNQSAVNVFGDDRYVQKTDYNKLESTVNANKASLNAVKHDVSVFRVSKFNGYKNLILDYEPVTCSTDVKFTSAEGVNLEAICVAVAGKQNNVNHVRIFEGYSTDDSDTITFVRQPFTIKEYNVRSWLIRHYHMSKPAVKGLRNGKNYQSALLYSNGDVITSDKQEYNNSPRGTAKAKKPLQVEVVNKTTNPVNTTTVK